MNAIRVVTLLSVLVAGSAFGADKLPCELLTRAQVATVVGAGAIATQYAREELPQRRAKELMPIHTCDWLVKETQSAVEVHLVAPPLDAKGMSFALTTLGNHGRRHRDDEREFGNVKGNALKVLYRSKTATPTIRQAKSLFDQAVAGL